MKLLFCISDKEINFTGGRFMQLLYRLSDHNVTVISNSDRVLGHIGPGIENINKVFVKPQEYVWTMQQRDKFAKKFINAFHDIKLCDDMAMWKAEGFDDYLWNVSQFVYPEIEGQYDLMIIPSFSQEDSPGHLIDEFFTSMIFKAKNNNIPIMIINILPSQFISQLLPKFCDYFCVKSQSEKEFLINEYNISENKIFIFTYKPDNYAIDSIEDPFKHYLFKTIQPSRSELNIVLMNHVQKRNELKETVKTIAETGIKFNLFFCMLNYAVKELHEYDIIRELLIPDFSKYIKQIQFIDIIDLTQVLISMDCLITMNYMTISRWCELYNIPHIIYENNEQLKHKLNEIFQNKQKQIGLEDAIKQSLSIL